MYEQDRTTKTWACIKAIHISKPAKAIIKLRGIKPKWKKMKPDVIILYVKPARIFNSICPLKIFAANLRPSDIARAR